MKDILVEFTDHGAIVHKDPSVIAAKRDLPYCFFNPELSKVAGVSPSYWVCNSDKEIVPASPEERKRRDEYHQNKPPENTVSLQQTLDQMQMAIASDLEQDIDQIYVKIDEIRCLIKQQHIELHNADNDLNISLSFVISQFTEFKENTNNKLNNLNKQLIICKIALIISVIIALIGALK